MVFASGVGQGSTEIQRRVCETLGLTGPHLDSGRNARGGERISQDETRLAAFALQWDEKGAIAAAGHGMFSIPA